MIDIKNREDIIKIRIAVRKHLLEDILSFWCEKTIDKKNGGYITAFDRAGTPLFDEVEKNIWMQARQVWMFAKIYSDIEHKDKWLYLAEAGYTFLLSSAAYAGKGRWNYLLSEDGTKVITGTVSIFTDAFVLMALCAYVQATGNLTCSIIIEDTFTALTKNLSDTNFKDIFPNEYQKNIVYHGIYMICMNALSEAAGVLGYTRVDPHIRFCLDKIFNIMKFAHDHYILECKYSDGTLIDTDAGKLLNPGHNFECLWFILREVKRLNLKEYYTEALAMFRTVWYRAKDTEYGGVFYMQNIESGPPVFKDWNTRRNLQWNEKVWWTHAEALCALAGYVSVTQDQTLMDEFEALWKYCLKYFWDQDLKEWYSVLHRDGSVRIANKGGLQKAAFHIPRSLCYVYLFFKEIEEKTKL